MNEIEQKISPKSVSIAFIILAVIFLMAGYRDINRQRNTKNSISEYAQASISEENVPATEEVEEKSGILADKTGDAIKNDVRENQFPIRNWDVPYFESAAEEAIITDIKARKILYQKNINEKHAIASITKLMTANVIYRNIEMSEIVKISKNAVEKEGDNGNLIVGEDLLAKDLLAIMLISSSNDAAYAFSDHFKNKNLDLVGLMNEKASELDLLSTRFSNPAGLDDKNHYSSAYDVALIISDMRWEDYVWQILRTASTTVVSIDNKFTHQVQNTNDLLGQINGIVGGKTGYTIEAKESLALVLEIEGQEYIFVVLGSNDRFADMKMMIEWAKKAYKFK